MNASQTRGLLVQVEQRTPVALSGGFSCRPGELAALVGLSGAGKTTMLRVIAGLLRPVTGRVQVGDDIWCDTEKGIDIPARNRHVGFVFQNYALMPHMTALENVALALLHLPREARLVEAASYLNKMGIDHALHGRQPKALSGGQQQRVALARALARKPTVLLLDEPFSAVDQLTRRGIYAVLAELRQELQIPVILVTHDLTEAQRLADKIVVIDQGTVLQEGSASEIYAAPRNKRVADLLGIQVEIG
jgi:molybdate transport system ATP-binding protein